MPARTRDLHEAEARRLVGERGFGGPGASPSGGCRVGVELEWFTVRADDPTRPADPSTVQAVTAALDPLPGASRVTYEPGGQLELSSPALTGLAGCEALRRDLAVLTPALASAGVALLAVGLAPGPERDRVISTPRYDAMETFFDREGDAGRTMMRSTAALQVNVDHGGPEEVERRWRLAQDVGPVLAAAFANSPLAHGRPSGWCSTRLQVWSQLDRGAPVGPGPSREAWADYALGARVMLVRRSATDHVALRDGLSFGDWIRDGHELGWPTVEDLDYHLTTLFPPVRPRGWLELRMIDALPDPWWRIAATVSTALVSDETIADEVGDAVATVRGRVDGRGPLRARRPGDGDRGPPLLRGRVRHRRRAGGGRRDPRRAGGVRRELRRSGPLPGRRPARVVPPGRPARPRPRRARARVELTTLAREELERARKETLAVLAPLDDVELTGQVSPLMSPLCWDLAHVAHYEELWLVRSLVDAPPTDPRFDDLYDAFRHPRRERAALDILAPEAARQFAQDVRNRVLEILDRGHLPDGPLTRDGFVYGMVVQHEHQHRETMLATIGLMERPYPDRGERDAGPPRPGRSTERCGCRAAR